MTHTRHLTSKFYDELQNVKESVSSYSILTFGAEEKGDCHSGRLMVKAEITQLRPFSFLALSHSSKDLSSPSKDCTWATVQ